MNLCGDILQPSSALPALQFGTIKPIITRGDGNIIVVNVINHCHHCHLIIVIIVITVIIEITVIALSYDHSAPESRDFQDQQPNLDRTRQRLQEKYQIVERVFNLESEI